MNSGLSLPDRDGEIPPECLAPDAISDAVFMQDLSGLKLQTH